ncbi:hypothetical protein IFM89_028050 [Coptis chinensis]|uniref:Valine--tRNA ligase, mitochondrial n=1 Tax=Coptis chinensis TaxID=261450 RepID=A0A835HI10_9MAGN|nr:hypothetical protein IFM89_028050 [Coptis chinensis]
MAEDDIGPTKATLERKKKKEEKEAKRLKAILKQQKASNVLKKNKVVTKRRGGDEDESPIPEDDPVTCCGEKKQVSSHMAKQYNPGPVEKSWYQWWENSGFFVADANSSKPPFVVILPPPNVTGALHIGHALTAAIQDTIVRWRRMSGYNTLWVPGMDHAGIATQVVVEKKIMRETKLTRHDIGRERFVSEVWKWKDEYGGTILDQKRRLGASLDWSRQCFTMDETRSKAVTEAFVRLHREGLIYRDYRLVNWDCVLRTAISDIEVDHKDIKPRTVLEVPGYADPVEFGVLTSFAYPLEGDLGEIVVATTRVETMLGDTAIAVHPEHDKYTHLHGKFAIHPFNGRKLKIICDEIADRDFGTGAVKITPAHDPNDFEVGKRHNLEFINIFTDDGKINSNGGSEFEGMPRFKARAAVIEALQKKGLYRGAEDNEMSLGVCSRSNDVMEPLIKPQWYVNCTDMAKEALDAVFDDDKRKIEIIPKKYCAEWRRWMENIRDWCISRQLWWGHRIPAWYVTLEDDQLKEFGAYNDHWAVGRNEEEAQWQANKIFAGKKFQLAQDPDVLDTWFSSALFPLSVLGWPENTEDFREFYPTSVLETGHDIIFFWVARMVMLGMKLGGDVPFRKVYLHPMIRDAQGKKMSKSKGNVVDPLEVINGISLEGLQKRLEEGNLDPNELDLARKQQEVDFPGGIPECGADALRFALVSYTAQSENINLDIKRVVGYRQMCNKLWNAVRFAMIKLGDNYIPCTDLVLETMPFSCRWILSVLNKAISKTVSSLYSYEFAEASTAVYHWWQFQLCDVFIEVIKPYFAGADPKFDSTRSAACDTLWICLDNGLRLLHPFMPFVTEELWQRLPKTSGSYLKESIMISEYPSVTKKWTNETTESHMNLVDGIVTSLRSLRSPNERHQRRPAFVVCRTDKSEIIKTHELEISTLASLSSLDVLGEYDTRLAKCSSKVVKDEAITVYLEGALNTEAELEKLRKRREELQKQHDNLKQMMSAAGYKQKVAEHRQNEDVAKLEKLMRELNVIEETASNLERAIAGGR